MILFWPYDLPVYEHYSVYNSSPNMRHISSWIRNIVLCENILLVQNKMQTIHPLQQLLLILCQNTGCSSLVLFPDHLGIIRGMFSLLYICFYSGFQFEYSLLYMVKGKVSLAEPLLATVFKAVSNTECFLLQRSCAFNMG